MRTLKGRTVCQADQFIFSTIIINSDSIKTIHKQWCFSLDCCTQGLQFYLIIVCFLAPFPCLWFHFCRKALCESRLPDKRWTNYLLNISIQWFSNNRGQHHWLCTCKVSSLLSGHRSHWLQVSLVAHQHDLNIGVGVFIQLLQPALHALISDVFGDVVDQQGSEGTSVIPVWRRRLCNCSLCGVRESQWGTP